MFGSAKYRNYRYGGDDHIAVIHTEQLAKLASIFVTSAIHKSSSTGEFNYGRNFYPKDADELNIFLPIRRNGKIDYKFMESFINELENEKLSKLGTYLSDTKLKDCKLTPIEQKAINRYEETRLDDSLWKKLNLEGLYGKSTRGRRLKSDDRISGDLPFVTAGEADEGVSAFIGNGVTTFSENTTTIDMFGSAKYRNYKYGGDDHITVVHTEQLDKMASIFVTSAIHKSSHTGEFHYGRNFYSRDADALDISLPVKNGKIDYDYMNTLISAVHKLVIKGVVEYIKERIVSSTN